MTRFVALACFSALVAFPGTAHAQSTQARLNSTRHAIDIAAQHWFAAQNKAAALDARIARLERDIASAEARVASAKHIATSLASSMYERASVGYTDMIGNDVIESARRAELIDRANSKNVSAIDELNASLNDLRGQHKLLVVARSKQADAVAAVASERASLDTKLASLRDEAQREAAAAGAGRSARRVAPVHTASVATASAPAFPTAPNPQPAAVSAPVAAAPVYIGWRRHEPAPQRSVPHLHASAREQRRLHRR